MFEQVRADLLTDTAHLCDEVDRIAKVGADDLILLPCSPIRRRTISSPMRSAPHGSVHRQRRGNRAQPARPPGARFATAFTAHPSQRARGAVTGSGAGGHVL
jgi:hypothetical protein